MGWSYDDWVGPFYPQRTPQGDFLRLYSSAFDTVEIDSSFYRMPSARMLEQWRDRTPGEFRFTMKLPRDFTHEGRLLADPIAVEEFEHLAGMLGNKLSCVLILLPPSGRFEHMFDGLSKLVGMLGSGTRYAVEFRNRSWFRSEVYRLLEDHGVALAWSVNQYAESPPVLTTGMIYLRFIGDRSISKFDRVRKDRGEVVGSWAEKVLDAGREYGASAAYVFSNNHFAGFAPGTVNMFRKMAGLQEIRWHESMSGGGEGRWHQTRLDAGGQ